MDKLTRRSFVTTVGAVTVVPATALMSSPDPAVAAAAAKAPIEPSPLKPMYLFFNADEVLFIEAACERLIPADESGPGALGAGVPNYLDKQLGGAWGAGERLYRSGPWQPGTPSRAINCRSRRPNSFIRRFAPSFADLETHETPFHEMSATSRTPISNRLRPARMISTVCHRRYSSTCCCICRSRDSSAIRCMGVIATWWLGA